MAVSGGNKRLFDAHLLLPDNLVERDRDELHSQAVVLDDVDVMVFSRPTAQGDIPDDLDNVCHQLGDYNKFGCKTYHSVRLRGEVYNLTVLYHP